jgi:branched-chain amino acid transport system ATP-binding protein
MKSIIHFWSVNTIKEEAQNEALKVLDFCNLTEQKDKLAKSLPIAGRERLEIARAIETKPKLLLLDETAAGLNPGALDETIVLIKKINQEGVTILLVEQNVTQTLAICDRALCS